MCQCLSGTVVPDDGDPSESASRSTDWNNKVALAQDGAGACATQRDSFRLALGRLRPGGSLSRSGSANEFPKHGENHSTDIPLIQTHPDTSVVPLGPDGDKIGGLLGLEIGQA